MSRAIMVFQIDVSFGPGDHSLLNCAADSPEKAVERARKDLPKDAISGFTGLWRISGETEWRVWYSTIDARDYLKLVQASVRVSGALEALTGTREALERVGMGIVSELDESMQILREAETRLEMLDNSVCTDALLYASDLLEQAEDNEQRRAETAALAVSLKLDSRAIDKSERRYCEHCKVNSIRPYLSLKGEVVGICDSCRRVSEWRETDQEDARYCEHCRKHSIMKTPRRAPFTGELTYYGLCTFCERETEWDDADQEDKSPTKDTACPYCGHWAHSGHACTLAGCDCVTVIQDGRIQKKCKDCDHAKHVLLCTVEGCDCGIPF